LRRAIDQVLDLASATKPGLRWLVRHGSASSPRVIVGIPTMLFRQLVGLFGCLLIFLFRGFQDPGDLSAELLLPRRCHGKRTKVVGPLLQLCQLITAANTSHLLSYLPVDVIDILR